jgi:hypothetical protein
MVYTWVSHRNYVFGLTPQPMNWIKHKKRRKNCRNNIPLHYRKSASVEQRVELAEKEKKKVEGQEEKSKKEKSEV